MNVVEFLCSAGIPAVFAQVLALSELAPWLEVRGSPAATRWSNALGGVALIAIGALLIFRPEWLAFA